MLGFFKKKDNQKDEKQKKENLKKIPITKIKEIEVDNYEEFLDYSKEYEVEKKVIKITNIKTTIDEISKQYVLTNQNKLDKKLLDKLICTKNVKITQKVKIQIMPKQIRNHFDFKIEINALGSKVKIIYKKQELRVRSKFKEEFLDEINMLKFKQGIIINLFNEEFLENIEHIIDKIKKLNIGEEFNFEVSNQPLLKEYTPSKYIELYKKTGVDSIKKNEKIIEYYYPNESKNSINVKGEYIEFEHKVESNQVDFKYNDTIQKEFFNIFINEDGEKKEMLISSQNNNLEVKKHKIIYIALKDGYVDIKNGELQIKNEMTIDKIDIKSGNVNMLTDKNVSLTLTEEEIHKDTVGMGMQVVSEIIDIKGSIAAKSKLKGNDITIGMQTHLSSYIQAKKIATIKFSKGRVESPIVNIESLESGIIIADEVNVKNFHGGKIYAKIINIENVHGNINCYASEKINIKNIIGGENIFVFQFGLAFSERKFYHTQNNKILDLQKDIKNKNFDFKHLYNFIQNNKDSYQKIKKMKNNIHLKSHLDVFEKNFQKYQILKKEIEILNMKVETSKVLIKTKEESIKTSKLQIEGEWVGFNKVSYIFDLEGVEFNKVPRENSKDTINLIIKNQEGNFLREKYQIEYIEINIEDEEEDENIINVNNDIN
jgi:hypothetical protein